VSYGFVGTKTQQGDIVTQTKITTADVEQARRVKVAVTDIDGVMRGKYLHPSKFASVLTGGFGFCDVVLGWDSADVCYENATFTGWHSGYPDAHVQLDPGTARKIPWEDNVPFMLGDFVKADGSPLPICPRQTLKRVIEYGHSIGYDARFGVEFEWFNFRETPETLQEKGFQNLKPMTPGMFGYSMLRPALNQPFFDDLMIKLQDFDVPVEGLHTETGPGVLEAALLNGDPLTVADRSILFKTATKQIAYQHGIIPTFMAKWNADLPGSSGHIHQSLSQNGVSSFHDDSDPNGMSETFKSYLAGQLLLLPDILALLAPTVNSFKRLVEGMWAPTKANWAIDNRTVALRVIPGSPKSTRVELRVGGADMNPYLAIAGAMAAGMYGVKNKLTLKDAPIVGNGYTANSPRLPGSLSEAADALDNSKIMRGILGDEFIDHFVQTRRWEVRQYKQAVTDWELQRYFEII
jgi:glutamine synthetase